MQRHFGEQVMEGLALRTIAHLAQAPERRFCNDVYFTVRRRADGSRYGGVGRQKALVLVTCFAEELLSCSMLPPASNLVRRCKP